MDSIASEVSPPSREALHLMKLMAGVPWMPRSEAPLDVKSKVIEAQKPTFGPDGSLGGIDWVPISLEHSSKIGLGSGMKGNHTGGMVVKWFY